MTAALRLVRHYLLRKRHVPRHAKPEPAPDPLADDLVPFSDFPRVHPYPSKGDAA
jgi:hypothetical protein